MNTLTIQFNDVPELKRKLKKLCSDFGLEGMTLADFKQDHTVMLEDVRIPRWIVQALANENITRLSQLENLKASDFVKIKGLGHAALREVNELLTEYQSKTIDN
jgi:DNA-directed RNA polymerase alpha subunit